MRGVKNSTPGCGTPARYCAGCHCQDCKHAVAREMKQRRLDQLRGNPPRTIDGTGTRRRIQALTRLGWSFPHIGARLGISKEAVRDLVQRDGSPVRATTARRVAAVYADLSMTPGPSKHAVTYATKHGWPPPLAWDCIDTDPAPNLPADPRDAWLLDVADLAGLGVTFDHAAARLGVTPEALHRRLKRHGRDDLVCAFTVAAP